MTGYFTSPWDGSRHAFHGLQVVEPVGLVIAVTDQETAQVLALLCLVVSQIDVLCIDCEDFDLAGLVG